ncbi:peptidyl-prolyl cis-trans isomerase FKBP16-1, chloroplastic [Dendrobium catenatum]|uniref:peptidyl-prolyl cis-trans isomerase FKBP16-1, chloroplastic n=1 Tax=Dendrobium catenatum TaxID=906689 RepID=UPI00109FE5FB|nr:peptidyl-prolyl cis-trans isomerase FKBP16-1, chloroplastic [Dendrobium catenatum]
MAACSAKSLVPLSCTSSAPRLQCKANKIILDGLHGGCSTVTNCRKSRRTFLWKSVCLGAVVLHANPSFSVSLLEMKEPEMIRYQKLKSGVKIEEIVEGEGPETHEGDVVEINYVCRRSNGYFVHSTQNQLSGESKPVIISLDGKEVIQGLKDVLVGMKVGGKRRALIPPSLGYINEDLKPIPDEFGPRRSLLSHAKEPLVFEVQLLKRL